MEEVPCDRLGEVQGSEREKDAMCKKQKGQHSNQKQLDSLGTEGILDVYPEESISPLSQKSGKITIKALIRAAEYTPWQASCSISSDF